METSDYLSLGGIFVSIIGWVITIYWQHRRDKLHKKSETRIKYLLEAFMKLALSAQRAPNSQIYGDLEYVVAHIQLLGTTSQNKMIQDFMNEWENQNKLGKAKIEVSLDNLLEDLRSCIRKELGEEKIKDPIRWFRPSGIPT